MRYTAPDFKAVIFGIVSQLPKIWLKNDGYFFDLAGPQDPCEIFVETFVGDLSPFWSLISPFLVLFSPFWFIISHFGPLLVPF